MTEAEETAPIREQPRARAVFSIADFKLIREALTVYIQSLDEDAPESIHARALYHRLGRVD